MTAQDPLRNRRFLAFLAAFHGFFIFPYVLMLSGLPEATIGHLTVYMATVTTAPICAYLYASHRKDCKNVT